MSNFDDIIGNYANSTQKLVQGTFDKNAWAEKKQQEREQAYEIIEKTANEVKLEPTKFKQYLDMQTKFHKHSVGNVMLILAQKPNATELKELSVWKDKGTFVKDIRNPITILEPNEYEKPDGTMGVSYNPKKLYDISQTNSRESKKQPNYSEREILQALLYECPVKVKGVAELPNPTNVAEYNYEENMIYIVGGAEAPKVFHDITKALAKAEMIDTRNNETYNFNSNCVSYMLCKKYGIDVSNYNFNELPNSFKEMDSRELRHELGVARVTMESINSRMEQCLENVTGVKQNERNDR